LSGSVAESTQANSAGPLPAPHRRSFYAANSDGLASREIIAGRASTIPNNARKFFNVTQPRKLVVQQYAGDGSQPMFRNDVLTVGGVSVGDCI
jgi:hypothetical protein